MSCSDALAPTRTGTLLPRPVVSGPSKVSRSSGGSRTARTDRPEARAHLAREIEAHQAKLDRYARLIAEGRKPMGRPPVAMQDSTRVQRAQRVVRHAETAARVTAQTDGQSVSDAKRLPKVVVNVTDPQSRIMPTRKGFLQGYNAQVAVTGDQLIIAVRVGQSTND